MAGELVKNDIEIFVCRLRDTYLNELQRLATEAGDSSVAALSDYLSKHRFEIEGLLFNLGAMVYESRLSLGDREEDRILGLTVGLIGALRDSAAGPIDRVKVEQAVRSFNDYFYISFNV